METYQETLAWMFSQLPMYQRKGAVAYRPDLAAMQKLDQYLETPHKAFKSIHIAGTNGKGSTAHMIASVLQTAGYKTALYTSPHLLDFRERIKVDGEMISKKDVVEFINAHKDYFESQRLSFFEMTVGLAFWYFKREQVDFAIIEVGLGGRLDATNIITPELSVITNIGLDHTQFLGNTHAEIAVEKAGIIKLGIPVVIGEKDKRTLAIFESIAKTKRAPLYFAENTPSIFSSDLKGKYQAKNIQTAISALNQLSLLNVDNETLKKGLSTVVFNTNLMGRWQTLSSNPDIILDVAHNKEGLTYISEQLKRLRYKTVYLVMGFVKGRDINELLGLFSSEVIFYFSSPNLERALPLDQLKASLQNRSSQHNFFKTIPIAFEKARLQANAQDLILVLGSTFVVAEVLDHVKK